VVKTQNVLKLKVTRYYVRYPSHTQLISGGEGKVLVRDYQGRPTVVVGSYGNGKVAFIGDFIGIKKPPLKEEGEVFLQLCNYLTPDKKASPKEGTEIR
jgi:hypothetical protein